MKEFDVKETGMFVPEGFFDKFQKELEEKIDQQEAQKLDILAAKKRAEEAKKATERRLRIQHWSIAACACLLIGLASFAWFNFDASQTTHESVAVPMEVAQADNFVSDIDSEDIVVSMVSDLDIYENFYADL